jgi:hypothetical protein
VSTTSPPVALTPGTSAQVMQPGGGQFGYVVLSNVSPYMLTLQIGADTFLLAPFTEQMYPLAHSTTSPLGITPTLLIGQAVVPGASAQANVTWYTFGEGKPQGNWPISLSAQALASIAGVLTVNQQYQNTRLFGNSPIAANSNVLIVTQGYASLDMWIQNAIAGQKSSLTIFWYYDTAGTQATGMGDNFSIGGLTTAQMADSYAIPVRGLSCRIQNNSSSAGAVNTYVQGTNKPEDTVRQTLTTILPRTLSFPSQTLTPGVPVNMFNADGLGDYTTLNGLIQWNFGLTSGNGFIQGYYTQYNATEAEFNANVAATGNGTGGTFNHPNLPVRWAYYPVVGGANIGGTVNFTPAGAV